MTTMPATGSARRLRAVWTGAHAPVAGTSRWARTAALAVPFTVLPSSLWRIAACTFHAPITRGPLDYAHVPSGVPGVPIGLYVILLSIASELAAFTAVGLVATWGETFPRWIPGLRGRAVPTYAAVIPAALGATALTVLWTWVMVSFSLGRGVDGRLLTGVGVLSVDDWKGLLAIVAYAPLLLWGPLLGAVTISYWKRRRQAA